MESMTNVFEAQPKKWGNSLGITIPSHIVKEHKLDKKKKLVIMILPDDNSLQSQFGSLPAHLWGGKTTQELLDEGDEGEDD